MRGWAVPGFVHVRQIRMDAVGRRVVARHRVNRKVVSITYLSPEFLADAEFRNRFAIESERLGQIRQAVVARVHQYVECGDRAAVVADHIEGTPLRTVLLEEGAIGAEAAVVVFKDALRGMAAGHDAGLVHGDVKPEDVVLTRAGRVRLVDFGLSTCAGRQLLARSTPFYLAPEQWDGGPATEPGDLYAATVTFFECLVGAPPFHADNAAELATLHERGTPPLDAVPGPVRDLVRSGLAKNPAARPDARRLLSDVEHAAAHGFGPGWERRGRRELSRLLSMPSHPTDVPGMPVPARHRGRERNVRLGAVLGGALVLAAGLSSPPLPSVLLPGSSGVSDPRGRPPVMAFPRLPGDGALPAHAHPPATGQPPDHQSAAMAESVLSTDTWPDVRLPSTGVAQPRIGSAVAEPAPAEQGQTAAGRTERSSAVPVPPAPRTTLPTAPPATAAPAAPVPGSPRVPAGRDPHVPGRHVPGRSEPPNRHSGPSGKECDSPRENPGSPGRGPSAPSEQGPSEQGPSEPSGEGRSAPPGPDPRAPAPSESDAAAGTVPPEGSEVPDESRASEGSVPSEPEDDPAAPAPQQPKPRVVQADLPGRADLAAAEPVEMPPQPAAQQDTGSPEHTDAAG